jgi:RNA polymerase sigma-70 factor (ECF subfamily)
VVALRQASKVRRDDARHRTLSESAVAAARLPASDPEIATLRRRYGPMTRDALRRGLAALDPQERTVLKLHFVDDLNLEAIAAVLGLSRATVGRRMLAARERVLAEAVRILGAELHATPTEVKSLFGLLRAELEITLGGVVAEAP